MNGDLAGGLADPEPPAPPSLDAVMRRANQITRRRRILAAGGSGTIAAIMVVVALLAVGNGGNGSSRLDVAGRPASDVTGAAAVPAGPVGFGHRAQPATSTTRPAGPTASAPGSGAGSSGGPSGPPTGPPGGPGPGGTRVPAVVPTTTPTRTSPSGSSGVEGHVMLSPTCPYAQYPPPGCQDQPAAGAPVWASPNGSTATSASTTSASDGSYHLALPPGTYQLRARAGMTCQPVTVVIQPGQISAVDITCDTGIR